MVYRLIIRIWNGVYPQEVGRGMEGLGVCSPGMFGNFPEFSTILWIDRELQIDVAVKSKIFGMQSERK